MLRLPRVLRVVLMMTLALIPLAGCGNDTTTPTSTAPLRTTEVYSGTLNRGESGFYSFNVVNAGTADITLASLTNTTTGRVIGPTMEVGVGVPAGEGCNTTTTMNVSPGLSAQISTTVTNGIYCTRIADIGNLGGATAFAVRIVHP
jgi:hypothetical protein